jgi:predicted transcriptional regulator
VSPPPPPPPPPRAPEPAVNPNRQRILDFIKANPGCSRQDIADAVGLTRTAVAHHFQTLRRADLAGCQRQGRRLLHFPVLPLPAPPTLLGLLRLDGARRVLEALAADPERSVRSVARHLGMAPHSVRWHLARFEREGLLANRRSLVGPRRFEIDPRVRALLGPAAAAEDDDASPEGGPAGGLPPVLVALPRL